MGIDILPATSGVASVAKTGEQSAPEFPYILRWNRKGRKKGQRCRMLTYKFNNCALEFEDGYQMVTSRNAVLRSPEFKDSVAVRGEASPQKAVNQARAGAGKQTRPVSIPG